MAILEKISAKREIKLQYLIRQVIENYVTICAMLPKPKGEESTHNN